MRLPAFKALAVRCAALTFRSFLAALLLSAAALTATGSDPPTNLTGDPLPPGALMRLGTVRLRHDSTIWTVAFAPDGQSVFTGSHDGTSRRWDLATGKEIPRSRIARIKGKPMAVGAVRDGRLLLATSDWYYEAARIHLWDAATGKQLHEIDPGQGGVSKLVFSGDGQRLASAGSRNLLKVWDVVTG